MSPKEKALQLFTEFKPMVFGDSKEVEDYNAKQAALTVVENVLDSVPSYKYWDTYSDETPSAITYWNEVKAEIESW